MGQGEAFGWVLLVAFVGLLLVWDIFPCSGIIPPVLHSNHLIPRKSNS